MLRPGQRIRSTALLDETEFENVELLLVEVNETGAVGLVQNKPFGRALNELEEFRDCPPVPIYWGGPVDIAHLFFLHRRPDLIDGGTELPDGQYWDGDFGQAVSALQTSTLTATGLRLFVGYCGWDAGELEAEIAEGSWELAAE